jgi:hypothetical protein
MEKAKTKSVYHGVEVNAYDAKDAFQKAIEKVKNSKALYQGGVFRDKPQSVKRIKAGKAPKVLFEKFEADSTKHYSVHTASAVTNVYDFDSVPEAKKRALELCLETKENVQLKRSNAQSLVYKVTLEGGTEGKYAVNLVEDNCPLND